MTRRLAVLVAAAAGVLALSTPAVAAPQPIGDCTTTSGVILAVDFSHWGGPVLRSCGTANGTTDTGYQLLNEGGWQTVGDHHDGPAFICRIGYSGYQGGTMYPTPDQDACIVTPPAAAYWSYWHANPGDNTWSYSQLGAMLYKPLPGSVDAWVFGATNIAGTEGGPGFTPDQVRAHNTTPAGGVLPPGPTGPVNTRGINTGPPPEQPKRTTVVAPKPTTTPAVPPSTGSGSPTPVSMAATSAPSTALAGGQGVAGRQPNIQNAPPRAAARQPTGSVLPVIIGVGLVVLIGTGAGVLIWRRRGRT